MNLILGTIWLAVAFGLFYWSWADPLSAPKIFDTGLSFGWFALLMFCYNIFRWWSIRQVTQRRTLEQQEQRKRDFKERSAARPKNAPDPNLDFTEKTPPRPTEPPGPSVN